MLRRRIIVLGILHMLLHVFRDGLTLSFDLLWIRFWLGLRIRRDGSFLLWSFILFRCVLRSGLSRCLARGLGRSCSTRGLRCLGRSCSTRANLSLSFLSRGDTLVCRNLWGTSLRIRLLRRSTPLGFAVRLTATRVRRPKVRVLLKKLRRRSATHLTATTRATRATCTARPSCTKFELVVRRFAQLIGHAIRRNHEISRTPVRRAPKGNHRAFIRGGSFSRKLLNLIKGLPNRNKERAFHAHATNRDIAILDGVPAFIILFGLKPHGCKIASCTTRSTTCTCRAVVLFLNLVTIEAERIGVLAMASDIFCIHALASFLSYFHRSVKVTLSPVLSFVFSGGQPSKVACFASNLLRHPKSTSTIQFRVCWYIILAQNSPIRSNEVKFPIVRDFNTVTIFTNGSVVHAHQRADGVHVAISYTIHQVLVGITPTSLAHFNVKLTQSLGVVHVVLTIGVKLRVAVRSFSHHLVFGNVCLIPVTYEILHVHCLGRITARVRNALVARQSSPTGETALVGLLLVLRTNFGSVVNPLELVEPRLIAV